MRGLERGLELALRILRRIYGAKANEKWIDDREEVIRIAAILEIESFVAFNLACEMEEGLVAPAPIWTDLKTFPYELFLDRVCIVTGGYPCQPFSQAGKQRGVKDPRHLFPYIADGIGATRPVLCYFENVANHLNQGYDEVRRTLQELGYTVKEGIFSASQVGAPHIRKRLFILAVANAYCTESSKKRGDLAKMLGISKVERQSEYSPLVSGGDRSELGDANDQRQQQSERNFRESRRRTDDAGEENVDNSSCGGNQKENKVCSGRDCSSGPSDATSKLGVVQYDSECPRLERHYWDGNEKVRWKEAVRSIASSSLWPAGQGIYQYEWEEPRLESGVGFTIDGFDFTEDLLRMAGNGVVPQQSAIAFLTLIKQFL